MDLLKIASDFQEMTERMATEELYSSLFREDTEGQTSGSETPSLAKDNEEGTTMNKTAGVEANKVKMSGVNSAEQDEFTQVQGVVSYNNGEIKDAMNKVASSINKLDELKRTATKEGTMTKYASLFESLEGEIRVAADLCRKALKENPDSCLNMNKEPTNDKPYGAYDKSTPAITHETQSDHTDWKNDKHDEIGLGVPKTEAEIARIAGQRLAAHKAVKIAMNLLGDRCPEEVIAAQGREFFAGMTMTAMDNTLRRIAETEGLYADEAPVAPVAPEATPAPVEATPAPACEPTAAMPVSEDPKCEKVEEVKAPDFTEEENKQIELEATRIASARKARIIEAANKRACEMGGGMAPMAPAPATAPVAAPMAPAPEAVPAPAPEATPPDAVPSTEADVAEFGLGQESTEDKGDPELAGLFEDETTEMAAPVASRTASAAFSGKLPRLGLNANSTSDELSDMWSDSEL